MGKLDGKVAIITGASSGVGRETCKLFATEGALVAGLARRKELLETLHEEITVGGGEFLPLVCDLFDSESVDRCVKQAAEKYGTVDILCNIAGITDRLRMLEDVNNDVYEKTMNGNLRSAFYMCRAVIPYMRNQKAGVIVNCSSIGGVKGYGGGAAYVMAKHAMVGLTRAIVCEYAYEGIRCNTVCPGGIETAMGSKALFNPDDPMNLDESGNLISKKYIERCFPFMNDILSRVSGSSKPEDVAKVVLFLAGDDSKYITGEEIISAGGSVVR